MRFVPQKKSPGSSASESEGPASAMTLPIALKSTALVSSSFLTSCLFCSELLMWFSFSFFAWWLSQGSQRQRKEEFDHRGATTLICIVHAEGIAFHAQPTSSG